MFMLDNCNQLVASYKSSKANNIATLAKQEIYIKNE